MKLMVMMEPCKGAYLLYLSVAADFSRARRAWTVVDGVGSDAYRERRLCSAAGMRARLATSVSGRRRPGVFLSNSIVYSGGTGRD